MSKDSKDVPDRDLETITFGAYVAIVVIFETMIGVIQPQAGDTLVIISEQYRQGFYAFRHSLMDNAQTWPGNVDHVFQVLHSVRDSHHVGECSSIFRRFPPHYANHVSKLKGTRMTCC